MDRYLGDCCTFAAYQGDATDADNPRFLGTDTCTGLEGFIAATHKWLESLIMLRQRAGSDDAAA